MAHTPNPARTLDPVLVKAFLDAIGNGFFSVTFLKADGSESTRRARLNVQSRMAHNELSQAARERHAKNGQIPFVDLDLDSSADRAKGWRCFKIDRVVSIRGAGDSLQA